MENITSILIMWFLVGVFINISVFAIRYEGTPDETDIWVTPKDVYDTTCMNWFGAVITYLLMFVIDPFWYIAKLIWWAFHVGR